MNSLMRARALPALLGAATVAAITLIAGPAAAQSTRAVRIAVPDSFPAAAEVPALLVRSGAHPDTPTLILNKRKLRPELMAAGVAAARALVARPIKPAETQVTGIASFNPAQPMSAGARQRSTQYLRQLETRPTTRIGNLGPGRWIEIPAP